MKEVEGMMKMGVFLGSLVFASSCVAEGVSLGGDQMSFYPESPPSSAYIIESGGVVSATNSAMKLEWDFSNGVMLKSIRSVYSGDVIELNLPLFNLFYTVDGVETVFGSAGCEISPWTFETVLGSSNSVSYAKRLDAEKLSLTLQNDHLSAKIAIYVGEGANYARHEIDMISKETVHVDRIDFFPGLEEAWVPAGEVMGVPFINQDCFMSAEHPSCFHNTNADAHTLECGFTLEAGERWGESTVVGVSPPGQMRRGFLHYLERERARPFHVFQHYNNWTVTTYVEKPYDEDTVRSTIRNWGEKLIKPYGVKIDSFALDDGWDDFDGSMWEFHKERFPNGFLTLGDLLEEYDTSIGIWLSPAGGYATAGKARRAYAKRTGLLSPKGTLSLAHPPYYEHFLRTISDIQVEQDVNYFKIDKLGGVAELNSAKRVFERLREIRPDVFINLTRDSWPSPFWLRIADSLWRGGEDSPLFEGAPGSDTRKWIVYRDGTVYENVVKKSPLYPISSLMTHGLIFSTIGPPKEFMEQDLEDFRDQAQSFFGSGINCQELYIDHSLMTDERWAFLAKLLKWSRENQEVFVDVRWVGGDPLKLDVYGWAAWSPDKSILTLRNPRDRAATFNFRPRDAFELPDSVESTFKMRRLWDENTPNAVFECDADERVRLKLESYQTVTWESVQ